MGLIVYLRHLWRDWRGSVRTYECPICHHDSLGWIELPGDREGDPNGYGCHRGCFVDNLREPEEL